MSGASARSRQVLQLYHGKLLLLLLVFLIANSLVRENFVEHKLQYCNDEK